MRSTTRAAVIATALAAVTFAAFAGTTLALLRVMDSPTVMLSAAREAVTTVRARDMDYLQYLSDVHIQEVMEFLMSACACTCEVPASEAM